MIFVLGGLGFQRDGIATWGVLCTGETRNTCPPNLTMYVLLEKSDLSTKGNFQLFIGRERWTENEGAFVLIRKRPKHTRKHIAARRVGDRAGQVDSVANRLETLEFALVGDPPRSGAYSNEGVGNDACLHVDVQALDLALKFLQRLDQFRRVGVCQLRSAIYLMHPKVNERGASSG